MYPLKHELFEILRRIHKDLASQHHIAITSHKHISALVGHIAALVGHIAALGELPICTCAFVVIQHTIFCYPFVEFRG